MPRYPAATVRALRFVRAPQLPMVLVIDSPLADFASDANHVLVAPVGTGLVFHSYAAPVVLATALVDGIAGVRPRRRQERLEAHEALVTT
jgi:DNA-binding MurR/RpiR family transcriptional regulator